MGPPPSIAFDIFMVRLFSSLCGSIVVRRLVLLIRRPPKCGRQGARRGDSNSSASVGVESFRSGLHPSCGHSCTCGVATVTPVFATVPVVVVVVVVVVSGGRGTCLRAHVAVFYKFHKHHQVSEHTRVSTVPIAA